ncbi:uncharacterized protein EI97DRAFT_417773 [Westerdykella ornata]|uniref:Fe2OG dioxygenase domain-containing protein n=1 Tax=Westerdykella ornata TaxID=318751 RepID=A0A6A6JKK7_WESOR|nr:uncharacterized protein EI97DRAFT_417773 [Westerdykella ornata]KAF2276765.1 hypothetical protein EI97DRAFT_417773 [Westerdykella ornata]
MSQKMLSLLDLISQNQPHFQTHQALLVIGLQNDFIEPDGRLPVDTRNGFLDRITAVVPKLRQLSTNIIWVQTLYEADRLANDPSTGEGDAVVVGGLVDAVESSTDDDDDLPKEPEPIAPAQSRVSRRKQRALDLLKKVSSRRRAAPAEVLQSAEEDEELFLLRSSNRTPACIPNSPGAEFVDAVKASIAKTDAVLQTTHYSAFLGTSLLLILRAKLVTEVYICGCITNVSVLATVIDAARHGIRINIISDCLGYRKQSRHDDALKKMVDYVDANLVTSRDILQRDVTPQDGNPRSESGSKDTDSALETRVGALRVTEEGRPTSSAASTKTSSQSRSATVSGRPRNLSDASYPESRLTTDTRLSDEQFAETLVQGAQLPKREEDAAAPRNEMVKSKIRMRRRPHEKKKEKEGERSKGEGSGKSREKKSSTAENKESEASKDAEKTSTPTPKSPIATTATDAKARPAAVVKAESSDNLNRSPSKQAQALKPSVSQPSLSAEKKGVEKKPSRMRLALSRNSRSESKKEDSPKMSPSPAKISEATKQSPTTTVPESSKTKKGETPKSPLSPTKATSSPSKPPTKTNFSSPDHSTNSSTPIPSRTKPVPPQPSNPSTSKSKKPQSLATFPVLGPGDSIAAGDSRILYDFLPPTLRHHTDRSKPLVDLIFPFLYTEIRWQRMLHQTGEVPRLVCCQGEFGSDGSMPVYRHPTDHVLPLMHFSPMVQVVRKRAQEIVGHPLNHVLIQLYRSGNDYISEHSDKTLDIVRGSKIVNVSFGAQRTMRLRTKKASSSGAVDSSPSGGKADKTTDTPTPEAGDARTTQRVPMPHNSIFLLGPASNANWLHSIQADKRAASERSEAELAYNGMRISLTFRHIGTFIDSESGTIWGQGATAKEKKNARDVVNNDEGANEKLVRAFSRENHGTSEEFSWEKEYGRGFDVLHFRDAPHEEEEPILFAGANEVENHMIRIFLAEKGIRYILLPAPVLLPSDSGKAGSQRTRQPTYRDADTHHTEVHSAIPILLYLDRYQPLDRGEVGKPGVARSYEVLGRAGRLVGAWGNMRRGVPTFEREDGGGEEGRYIAGRRFSVGDCAVWSLLDEVIGQWEEWDGERWRCLERYYRGLWEGRQSVRGVRGELSGLKRRQGEEERGEAKDKGKEKEQEEIEEEHDEEEEEE